jgi:GAF domain-containing protein
LLFDGLDGPAQCMSETAPTFLSTESTANTDTHLSQHLQELVLNSTDVGEFLDGLAKLSSSSLSTPGDEVLTGITLLRHKRSATVASSSTDAQAMDEIQYAFGDGPCMTASRDQVTILVPDLQAEERWPQYTTAVLQHGVRSILAVPFHLQEDTKAALNLYSHRTGRFDEKAIELVEQFVRQTSLGLMLAVRFAHLAETADNLKAALVSRTDIDLAVGIIMAQNRCSQESAVEILKTASSARNVKLREVAAGIVASLEQGPATTYYED